MIKPTLYSLLFSLILNSSPSPLINPLTSRAEPNSLDLSNSNLLYFSISSPKEKYDSVLILGSKEKRKLLKRADGALEKIIFPYNVQKIVVSGGCTKYCRKGKMKTEAEEMFLRLTQHGIPVERITLEDRAMSTEQNYLYSRRYFQEGEQVVVVSDEKHAKAVAYCLRHNNGINAYYYILGKSSSPEVPSERIPGSKEDYFGLARKCKNSLYLKQPLP